MSKSKKLEGKQSDEQPKLTPIAKKFQVTERDTDLKERHILEYHVFAPEGSTIDDFKAPDCWAHVAHKFTPLTEIRITEKTGKWIALLTVVSCTRLSAVTDVIWHKDIAANASMPSTDNFEVRWINHQDKFGVFRKSDNTWVAKNLPTSADAAIVLSAEMQAYKRA